MRRLADQLATLGDRWAPGVWSVLCALLCGGLAIDLFLFRSLPIPVSLLGPIWIFAGGIGWAAAAKHLSANDRNPIFWLVALPFIVISFAAWSTVWYLKHPGAAFVPDALLWIGFSYGLVLVLAAAFTVRWLQRQLGWTNLTLWGIGCLLLVAPWQFGLFATEYLGWEMIRYYIARIGLIAIFLSGLAWAIRWVDLKARQIDEQRIPAETSESETPSAHAFQKVFCLAGIFGVLGMDRFLTGRSGLGLLKLLGLGGLAVGFGVMLSHGFNSADSKSFALYLIDVPYDAFNGDRTAMATSSLALGLLIGWLADLMLLTAGQYRDGAGRPVLFKPVITRAWRTGPLEAMNVTAAPVRSHIGNPLDLGAWYYGRAHQKLKQSLNTTVSYTLAFCLVALLLMLLPGCMDIYEMPAGGGDPQLKRKVVKVQKVKKKVYVVNPFSAVLFNPDIERIQLKLEELTKHLYEVGQGKGKGAGFAGGTRRGMVRFIRLKYSSGDWDQDMDLNSDLNMLTWYAANTGHKTAKKPEVRTVRQLASFPVGKSPPFVYLTGQRSMSLSRAEIETLREYVTTKHGMLFADNGGSSGWHSQFFNLMRQVLPRTDPRVVPLDHPVHDGIPFLPIVAPHGGRTAYMWVVENRIVAYYHPGDIGDAWADGHAGVPRPVWEACYRLGANIILYSHSEYSKWLQAQKKKN